MNRKVSLILGPPGTGKTTELLKIAEQFLQKGVCPSKIAFVTFTKKAAAEAIERAAAKFGIDERDLPYFRTLHSHAYRQLGIRPSEVMGKADYTEIAKLLGTEFKGYTDQSNTLITQETGDSMLQLISVSRATGVPLKRIWQYHDQPVDWYRLKLFFDTIEQYKKDTGKCDFSDMLEIFTNKRCLTDVDVAIIDEAQDLSNAQWNMCKTAFRKAKHVYVAGDDDQAIYEWSGANVDRLLNIKAEKRILEHTYRLPASIFKYAQRISQRISRRYAKTWFPRDEDGGVFHLGDIHQLPIRPGQSWMLLARNGYMLQNYKDFCDMKGIPYRTVREYSVDPEHITAIKYWEAKRKGRELTVDQTKEMLKFVKKGHEHSDIIWHDALEKIPVERREYYLACLRNGFKLDETVFIGTIHSVKGGEADNVAIMSDISYRTQLGYDKHPDAEHRAFYVGVTRAKQQLHLIDPQTANSYVF